MHMHSIKKTKQTSTFKTFVISFILVQKVQFITLINITKVEYNHFTLKIKIVYTSTLVLPISHIFISHLHTPLRKTVTSSIFSM